MVVYFDGLIFLRRGRIIMKKKSISVLLCMMMVISILVAGCGKDSAKTTASVETTEKETNNEAASESSETKNEDIKLGYICMNIANPWFVEVKQGFEAACEELGVQSMVIDSKYDVDKQVSDLESLINDNYSGIMISPIDQNATESGISKANEAGIVTACIAQSQDNVDFRYIVDEYKYGQIIGSNAVAWINENLGDLETVKVAIISQDNVEDTIKRGDGVQETLEAECPNVEIVARQAGDTAEGGLKIIESVLAQNPDLNVVVATNDSGGIGGYQALVNAGFTGDDPVGVFSGDATDEALNAMKEENSIYRGTADLVPFQSGYDTAMKLYEYITEGKPDKQVTQYYEPLAVPQADLLDGTYVK